MEVLISDLISWSPRFSGDKNFKSIIFNFLSPVKFVSHKYDQEMESFKSIIFRSPEKFGRHRFDQEIESYLDFCTPDQTYG